MFNLVDLVRNLDLVLDPVIDRPDPRTILFETGSTSCINRTALKICLFRFRIMLAPVSIKYPNIAIIR